MFETDEILGIIQQLNGLTVNASVNKSLVLGVSNLTVLPPTTTPSEALRRMRSYTITVTFDLTVAGEVFPIVMPFLYPIGAPLCRFDPIGEMESELAGTFCYGGKIRVVPNVERLVHNKIFAHADRVEIRSEHLGPSFRYRSTSTLVISVGTVAVRRESANKKVRDQVVVTIPFLKHPVPFIVLMIALGETRAGVLALFASPLCARYRPSAVMLTRLSLAFDDVNTQEDAYRYLVEIYAQDGKTLKTESVKSTLRTEILPHMMDSPFKHQFLVYMAARAIHVHTHHPRPDSMDDYRFIGVDDAHHQVGALVRRHLRSSPTSLVSRLLKHLRAGAKNKKRFDGSQVAAAIMRAIGTGRWSDKKQNVSESVQPQNAFDIRAATRRINAACSDTSGSHLAMRITHPSSHGYICCVETPDGGKSGLVGALALYASVSPAPDDPMPAIRSLVEISESGPGDLVFDHLGRLVGYCADRTVLMRAVRYLRRGFHISPTVGVSFAPGEVHVEGARGRLLRLLRIAGVPDDPRASLHQRLLAGSIEYLCAAEEFTTDIVTSYRESAGVTHVELSDVANLGDLAAVEPFGAFEQGPRRAFQSHMRRSATVAAVDGRLGMPTVHRLSYAQKAIVTTVTAKTLNLDPTAYINMITAVLPHPRATDDGMVISQRIVDTLDPILSYHTYTAASGPEDDALFCVPEGVLARTGHLCANGVPAVGTRVEPDDIVIGLVARRALPPGAPGPRFRDTSVRCKLSGPGRVVESTVARGIRRVVVLTSQRIQRGDKLVLTAGAQKGVVAYVEATESMPYCADGQPIDLIMDPKSYPSRMTPSVINTLISGLSYAVTGVPAHDTQVLNGCGTPASLQGAMDGLAASGFHPEGKVAMINGTTGERYSELITVGVIPVMIVHRHNAADKSYARSDGPKNAVRQTTQGRQHEGGLRLGTMEVECTQAHGAVRLVSSLLTDNADKFTVYICRACGLQARGNTQTGIYYCDSCSRSDTVRAVALPYSTFILFSELEATGIQARFELDEEPEAKRIRV